MNSRTVLSSFELVYVSADRSSEEFSAAMSEMPIFAIPFDDALRRKRLMTLFRAESLPLLLLFGPDGDRLTNDISWVFRDEHAHQWPWKGRASERDSSCTLL